MLGTLGEGEPPVRKYLLVQKIEEEIEIKKLSTEIAKSKFHNLMVMLDQHRHNYRQEFEEIYSSFEHILTPHEIKSLEFSRMLTSLKTGKINRWRNIVTTMATESFNEKEFTQSENGSLPVNIWRTPELQSEAINSIDNGGVAEFVHKMLLAGDLDGQNGDRILLTRDHVKKTIQHMSNMVTRASRKEYETTSIAYERTVRLLQKEVKILKNQKLASGSSNVQVNGKNL